MVPYIKVGYHIKIGYKELFKELTVHIIDEFKKFDYFIIHYL